MRTLNALLTALTMTCTLWGAGCGGASRMVTRPTEPGVDSAITGMWTQDVARAGQDGDWLISRSYAFVADVIVTATPGAEFSHAAVLDAERGMVIEAVESGVREIPLRDFVARNHYVSLVRPGGQDARVGRQVLARARGQVGKAYDMSGLIGLDDGSKFYCSELAYWAAGGDLRFDGDETIVLPSDLFAYGAVVYWSGKRDEIHLRQAAARRVARETQVAIGR